MINGGSNRDSNPFALRHPPGTFYKNLSGAEKN
jgi:hypothetical protein